MIAVPRVEAVLEVKCECLGQRKESVMYGEGIRRDCVTVHFVGAGLECRDWTPKRNAFVVACDLDGRGSLGKEIREYASWGERHLFTHGHQHIIHRYEMPDSKISVVKQVLNGMCATKIHSEL
jgi:hypothetical protein